MHQKPIESELSTRLSTRLSTSCRLDCRLVVYCRSYGTWTGRIRGVHRTWAARGRDADGTWTGSSWTWTGRGREMGGTWTARRENCVLLSKRKEASKMRTVIAQYFCSGASGCDSAIQCASAQKQHHVTHTGIKTMCAPCRWCAGCAAVQTACNLQLPHATHTGI